MPPCNQAARHDDEVLELRVPVTGVLTEADDPSELDQVDDGHDHDRGASGARPGSLAASEAAVAAPARHLGDKRGTERQTGLDQRPYETRIVWSMVLALGYVHAIGVYGLWLAFTAMPWSMWVFEVATGVLAGLGVTAAAHRLWSHRAYKAKLPLRIFLMCCQTLACEGSIIFWVRDHRVHHKHEGTVADPYNARRGFFFAHMGWLLSKKHPAVKERGGRLDFGDLYADPVVLYQHRYFPLFLGVVWFAAPVAATLLLWPQFTAFEAMCLSVGMRTMVTWHITWLVNSAAHVFGNKPYDRFLTAVDVPANLSFLFLGEGWHNYHHAIPWDYRAPELGMPFSLTSGFIDLMAWLGLAYDLKVATPETVANRIRRTGDDTYQRYFAAPVAAAATGVVPSSCSPSSPATATTSEDKSPPRSKSD